MEEIQQESKRQKQDTIETRTANKFSWLYSLSKYLGIKSTAPISPILEYNELDNPFVMNNIKQHGLDPMPILMSYIYPLVLERVNFHVVCPTISDKDRWNALLLPVIHFAHNCLSVQKECSVVILVPSCDPLLLLYEKIKALSKGITGVNVFAVMQQLRMSTMLKHANESPSSLILATPAALLDLINNPKLKTRILERVKLIIIDDADTMEYRDQLSICCTIASKCSDDLVVNVISKSSLQGINLFSINNKIVFEPNNVSKLPCCKKTFLWVEEVSKRKKLVELLWLETVYMPPIVIFVESFQGVGPLSEYLTALNPDKGTDELNRFANDKFPILVACCSMVGFIRNYGSLPVNCMIFFDFPRSLDFMASQSVGVKNEGWIIAFVNSNNRDLFPALSDYANSPGSLVTPLPKQMLNKN